MKKILNDKLKKDLREIWKDDHEDDYKSRGRALLEVPINVLRFELLYPKIQYAYDGEFPKGMFHALPINIALCTYMGFNMNGADGAGIGFGVGALGTIAQMALGSGVRAIGDKFIHKYNKKRDLKYHARDYNF